VTTSTRCVLTRRAAYDGRRSEGGVRSPERADRAQQAEGGELCLIAPDVLQAEAFVVRQVIAHSFVPPCSTSTTGATRRVRHRGCTYVSGGDTDLSVPLMASRARYRVSLERDTHGAGYRCNVCRHTNFDLGELADLARELLCVSHKLRLLDGAWPRFSLRNFQNSNSSAPTS
jgi:hypothetical protein